MADDGDFFVDVNLDDVDDGRSPLPPGATGFRIAAAEAKKKSDAGSYPYIELTLNPQNAEQSHRKAWLNLSFHPKALWNAKLFCKDGVAYKWSNPLGDVRKLAADWVGKTFGATVTLVPDTRSADPDAKRNEIGPPYFRA